MKQCYVFVMAFGMLMINAGPGSAAGKGGTGTNRATPVKQHLQAQHEQLEMEQNRKQHPGDNESEFIGIKQGGLSRHDDRENVILRDLEQELDKDQNSGQGAGRGKIYE